MDEEGKSPPPVSVQLVEWLDGCFPLKPADLRERTRNVWFAAGQQSVLAKLRSEHERQTQSQDEDEE